MHTRLIPGVPILDPGQSVQEAEVVARLLEAELDAGPDGTQVIARGWLWASAPLVVVCVTTDN